MEESEDFHIDTVLGKFQKNNFCKNNGWLIIMREGHAVDLLFHFPIQNT